MTATHTRRVREPRQARSLETYNRMLDAAEEVLLEKSFDDASVAEIATRAGVTIGAFYARFEDKEALLRRLEERMIEELDTVTDEGVNEDWVNGTLEEMFTRHHRRLIAVYRARRAVARALVLRSHTDPALKARLDRINFANLPRIASAIREHAQIDHPHPAQAIQFILLTVRSVCRETILFRESWPNDEPISDDVLAHELTLLLTRYLGIESRLRA